MYFSKAKIVMYIPCLETIFRIKFNLELRIKNKKAAKYLAAFL